MPTAPSTPRGGDVIPAPTGEAVALHSSTVQVYESMIEAVPDAGADGIEGILDALARATDVRDLDAPWRSAGLDAYLNVELTVTGIRKLPSDYAGGLSWFLIIDGATADGEVVSITTGATMVVAQLVRAFALGGLPVRVIPRQSERPSRNGYYPQHLEILG